MIRMGCDALLFDLDGVLIDSAALVMRHWREWARRRHIPMADISRVAHGRRTVETIRLVAPHLSAEHEARQFAAAEAADTHGVTAIEGAASLLEALPADSWAIATSGTRDLAVARLRRAGLPVPHILVTAEDVTNGKPDPEPYLAAAKTLGVPAGKCVVVEDSPAGIEAGASAGMQTVGIATTHTPHELARASAVVRRLGDIYVELGQDSRLVIQIGVLLPPDGH